MHESIVFCSTCTMSFAISSPDEFLVTFPSIVVAARPDCNSLQSVLLTYGIVCRYVLDFSTLSAFKRYLKIEDLLLFYNYYALWLLSNVMLCIFYFVLIF